MKLFDRTEIYVLDESFEIFSLMVLQPLVYLGLVKEIFKEKSDRGLFQDSRVKVIVVSKFKRMNEIFDSNVELISSLTPVKDALSVSEGKAIEIFFPFESKKDKKFESGFRIPLHEVPKVLPLTFKGLLVLLKKIEADVQDLSAWDAFLKFSIKEQVGFIKESLEKSLKNRKKTEIFVLGEDQSSLKNKIKSQIKKSFF